VAKDTTRSFNLVLALDISTPAEDLDAIREAVKSFIDTLGAQDQVAVVAFYDEVRLDQDFTSNKRVLNATINALGAQGSYTALNQAVLESVERAGTLPPGHRAVVVITDSANNIGTLSTADVVSQTLAAGVPVYAIGFGSKVRSQDLQEMARLTRGRSFILSSADEVRDNLREIAELLRQGYEVTFQSGLKADDAQHDLTLGVTYEGQAGQAEGHFVAVPGEVIVTLSGLADGQQVGQGEVINLSAQVTAPGPGVAVEYLLDDESLAQQDTPPYSFDWDSAGVEPGAYELVVKAEDGAGNTGQAQVAFDVALPLVVTLSTPQAEVQLGNEVTVEVQVEALAEVAAVEFLLDGQSLGSDSTSPYSFSFDSSSYLTGEHTVAARAVDSLGREGEASLAMAFTAPPPTPEPEPQPEPATSPSPSWSTIIVSGIAVAIIVAALVALILLLRWEKKRYQKAYRLEISNQGNAPSRYELQAQDPSGTFEFEFALGGTNLQRRPVSTALETLEPAPAREPVPPSAVGDAEPGRLEGAREVAGKAASAGGALASALSKLSIYLPGSAGRSARRASSQLRRGRMQTQRADRLAGRVAKAQPAAAPARAAVESAPAVTGDASIDRSFVIHTWAQTPLVEPGETLAVDLLVNPIKSYQSQLYSFTLLSRSVEQEEAPSVKEEVSVHMVRPSWLRRLYPYLVVLGVMVVTVVLYLVFLTSG
jgi:hypothetical protein